MNTKRVFSRVLTLALFLTSTASRTLAQQPVAQSREVSSAAHNAQVGSETLLTNLIAQAPPNRRAGFYLMPSSGANMSEAAFTISPAATGPNLTVLGAGTLGRLPKWTGFTSSNSSIGDSGIYEDKFGKVGIGTDSPTSKLTVAGAIESSSGGVKFPDGTVQTTAGIAANQIVLVRDLDNPARQPVQTKATCASDFVGCTVDLSSVPAGKRLVIEFVSMVGKLSIAAPNARLTVTTMVGSQQVNFACNGGTVLQTYGPEVVVSQSVRLYADPGTIVSFSGQSNSGVSHTYEFSLSGYLVDMP